MDNITTTVNRPLPELLESYMSRGDGFLNACREARKFRKDDRGYALGEARRQIDDLTELAQLLQQPERQSAPAILKSWLPKGSAERERRYYSYLLWRAFVANRKGCRLSAEPLSEKMLLKALHAGQTDFERKHHIFNLLTAKGFSHKQSCILAKYLGQ